MASTARRREVVYVLHAQKHKGPLHPVSTHKRHVEALQDAKAWEEQNGWHRVVQRVSIPQW